MELIWTLIGFGAGGLYLYSIYVCFQKGKTVFGWLGLSAITVFLAPLVIWFPIAGALGPAKPDSRWATEHHDQRFGGPSSGSYPAPSVESDERGRARIIAAFLVRAVNAGIINGDVRDRLLELLYEPPAAVPIRASATPATRGQLITTPAPPHEIDQPLAPPVIEPQAPPREVKPPPARPVIQPPPPPPVIQPPPPPPVIEPPALFEGTAPPASRVPPTQVAPGPTIEERLEPVLTRLRAAWDTISAEVALHGLAYLGVLLTFVGVLGFLLFAFQDVSNSVQPFVELFIAVVFFGWAWILRRQQADNVANAMELLAGMILPLIIFAGFVDGAPFPPNFEGGVLVAVLVGSSVILAFIYASIARRRPTTMLRFLVVPLLWLAGLALGFVFKTDEPLYGIAITRFVAAQPALAAVTIALSLTPWARHRLGARSVPVAMPALYAAPAAYLLAVILSVGKSNATTLAASAAGLATIFSAHFLADHFDRKPWALLATPVLLAGAVLPVVPSTGLGWAGLVAVGGYVALIEWLASQSADDRTTWQLAAVGVAAGSAMSFAEPWPAVAAFGFLTIWLHWRRAVGLPIRGAAEWLAPAAALAPFGFGWGLWNAVDPGFAVVATAAISTLAATGARWRADESRFWELWPAGTALVVGATTMAFEIASPVAIAAPSRGASIAAIGLATVTIALGRRWLAARWWLAGGFLATDFHLVLDAMSASSSARAVVWAGVGVFLIAAPLLGRSREWDHPAAIGHIIGTAALFVPVDRETAAAVVVLWAVSWLLSLVATSRDRASLTRLLTHLAVPLPEEVGWVGTAISWLVPVLFVVSAPAGGLMSLNLWGEFAANRAWTGIALAGIAITYGVSTRAVTGFSQLRRVLAIGAGVTVVLGVAIAAPVPWPTILATGASIVVALSLAPEVRHAALSWFAWIMSGVMIVLLAERFGVAPHRLYLVVLVWGATLFAGGLVADDLIAGRRAPGEGLRTGWARFPVLLGALAVPASLGPNFARGSTVAGWSAVGAAGAYGTVSWLLRSPLPTLPGYALAAFGLVSLLDVDVAEEPMVLVAVAAVLVAASFVTRWMRRAAEEADFWSSWYLPPLLIAHLAGILALMAAMPDTEALPWMAIGGLSVIVGIWMRKRVWLDVGHVLILVGAGILGTGALAVGFALTSIRAMVEVYRAAGTFRLAANGVAVLAAATAWGLFIVWSDWNAATTVSSTALMAGFAALTTALLARRNLVQKDTATAWMSWAVLGILGAAGGLALDEAAASGGNAHIAIATALLAFAAAAHLLGTIYGPAIRLSAAPLTGLAWLTIALHPNWDPAAAVTTTAALSGAGALTLALLARRHLAQKDTTAAWATLATITLAIAALVAFATEPAALTTTARVTIATALLAFAAAAHLLGTIYGPAIRLSAAPLTGLAWLTIALHPNWDPAAATAVTGWLGGLISLSAVEMHSRTTHPEGEGLRVYGSWVVLGATFVAAAALITGDLGVRELWASGVAPGLGLIALAMARGASSLGMPNLRQTAAVGALGSLTALAYGTGGGLEAITTAGLSAAVVGSAILVRFGPKQPDSSVWLRPLEWLVVAANLEAAIAAAALLPAATAVTAVLLSVGLEAALLGLVRRNGPLLALSPPLLAAAAVLLVADIATGSVQWYTLPLGLVVLAEIDIARLMLWPDAPRTERDALVMVEYLGIGLTVIPGIVEMFVSSLAAGAVSFVIAVGLMVWAILTKIRRRAIAAAVVAAGTAVLMISAALAGNAPDSAALWIIAAGLGFTVMSAAGVIEAARSRRGRGVRRLDELMGDWQ